ncbi:MAG: leucine-rich repeat domain-containing protein [Clostridia bacterium]|nr:leucine-rich repeat domain-containing protein [Clostridia bacterium]
MKFRVALLLAAVLVLLCGIAMAEKVTYRGLTFDTSDEVVDIGTMSIGASQWKEYYAFLEKFPNLKHVVMWKAYTYRVHIDYLTEHWPDVQFDCTLWFGDGHHVRTDQTAFSTLHGTTSAVHNADEISIVKYCKKLKGLDFGHNGVADISFLYELPNLRVLICAINRITDITPIGSLKKLEYLELFTNYVTDLSPLVGLTHLIDLNIGYNLITDLRPLTKMPWLKRVWMYRATDRYTEGILPERQQKWLKRKLPNTTFDFGSNPCQGGWRIETGDAHYPVINKMFRGGYYIPFADSYPDDD